MVVGFLRARSILRVIVQTLSNKIFGMIGYWIVFGAVIGEIDVIGPQFFFNMYKSIVI